VYLSGQPNEPVDGVRIATVQRQFIDQDYYYLGDDEAANYAINLRTPGIPSCPRFRSASTARGSG
jgi:hypothetical protein